MMMVVSVMMVVVVVVTMVVMAMVVMLMVMMFFFTFFTLFGWWLIAFDFFTAFNLYFFLCTFTTFSCLTYFFNLSALTALSCSWCLTACFHLNFNLLSDLNFSFCSLDFNLSLNLNNRFILKHPILLNKLISRRPIRHGRHSTFLSYTQERSTITKNKSLPIII